MSALYFEAKASSFGTASSNTKQARGHLLACGPDFGEVYSPLSTCLLCYLVPDVSRSQMRDCLHSLSNELNSAGFHPGPFSCHGLAQTGTQIIYSWDSTFKEYVGESEDCTPILNDVTDDTDPSPLILVFSDEDCANDDQRDMYRRAVIEQVRSCLLTDLHADPSALRYDLTTNDLLLRTTDGVFEYIGYARQRGLRRLVRENVLRKIAAYWKDKQPGIRVDGNSLQIDWANPGEKETFLDWLEDRHWQFESGRPTTPDPDLFDGSEGEKRGA